MDQRPLAQSTLPTWQSNFDSDVLCGRFWVDLSGRPVKDPGSSITRRLGLRQQGREGPSVTPRPGRKELACIWVMGVSQDEGTPLW